MIAPPHPYRLPRLMGPFSVLLSLSVLSHVFGAVDKTSSSFSAHVKIGNFIIFTMSMIMPSVLYNLLHILLVPVFFGIRCCHLKCLLETFVTASNKA